MYLENVIAQLKLKSDFNLYIDFTDPEIYSVGDKSEVITVSLRNGLNIPEKVIPSYRKDAKRILDAESKSLNKEGIKRLLAALIIEVMGDANFGKEN